MQAARCMMSTYKDTRMKKKTLEKLFNFVMVMRKHGAEGFCFKEGEKKVKMYLSEYQCVAASYNVRCFATWQPIHKVTFAKGPAGRRDGKSQKGPQGWPVNKEKQGLDRRVSKMGQFFSNERRLLRKKRRLGGGGGELVVFQLGEPNKLRVVYRLNILSKGGFGTKKENWV